MEKGMFIVLDGTDGSGKGTQTRLLVKRLREEGHQVEMADFPQYGQPSAHFVERYLRGEFGQAKDVGGKRASIFYALDRYAASFQIQTWLNDGKIVISNRYTSANKGHQLAQANSQEEMHEFLNWVNHFEYETLKIPKPNMTLFLHMKPDIGQKLVDQKESREYTQGKKRDILEADLEHLKNAEQAFLFCLENDKVENWDHIICFKDNIPRSIPEINEEIYKKVKEIITQ